MLFSTELHLSGITLVTCIFAGTGTYHLPRNSCEFLRFVGEVVSTCFSFQGRIFLFLCQLRAFLPGQVLTTSLGGLPSRQRRSVFPGSRR